MDKSESQGLTTWYPPTFRVLNLFLAESVSSGSMFLGGIGAENLKTCCPGQLELG